MVDYANLKVPELKKLLQDRQLPISGNKADLIARLQENDSKKSGTAAPAAPSAADDEIDWDEDETTTAKPAAVPAAPATTQPAAAAVAAGGQGPIDTPINVPNQKQDTNPATTHDLKVAATPEVAASTSPEAEKKPAPASTPSAEPAQAVEPAKPAVDFTAGVALTDAEKEAKKRADRAKRFGAVQLTDEEKKLKERAAKFGGQEADKVDDNSIKILNEGLPERKKRERKEQGGRAEGPKRQTPDRSQGPKPAKNEKKPTIPVQKQTTAPPKKLLGVLDDPVERAKAEARAAKFGPKA